jgi:hypothetical protein
MPYNDFPSVGLTLAAWVRLTPEALTRTLVNYAGAGEASTFVLYVCRVLALCVVIVRVMLGGGGILRTYSATFHMCVRCPCRAIDSSDAIVMTVLGVHHYASVSSPNLRDGNWHLVHAAWSTSLDVYMWVAAHPARLSE